MYGRGAAPGETVLDRYVVERRCLWCPRRVKPQPAMCPGWSRGRSMRTTLAYEATSSSWSEGGAHVDWSNREVIR
jgi:hypothetical protein